MKSGVCVCGGMGEKEEIKTMLNTQKQKTKRVQKKL